RPKRRTTRAGVPSRPPRVRRRFPPPPRRVARRAGRSSTEPESPRDDHLHDLVRAGIDRLHGRVGVVPSDRVLHHEAIAAVELQALTREPLLEKRRACPRKRSCSSLKISRLMVLPSLAGRFELPT